MRKAPKQSKLVKGAVVRKKRHMSSLHDELIELKDETFWGLKFQDGKLDL